ncbi:MAG: T9SS type A sorting domain-containing protein [Bacteroidia bacterium]|nr:T9SS type A sorting domain-containing protein [Bacteroidia bacterium]
MKKLNTTVHIFTILFFLSLTTFSSLYAQSGLWTWVHGDSAYYTSAVYGIKGIADSSNVPPGLYAPVYWTGKDGKFWIYGGKDYNSGYYSDLWQFDPDSRMWTWVKGDSGLINQPPTFGTRGVSSPTNSPGCRGLGSPAWTDTSGNLWLYGGYVKNRTGTIQYNAMNDLWKFDIQTKEWTWMQGDSVRAPRVLGTKYVSSPANTPGWKDECSDSWVDANNNFWFYGGGEDFWPEQLLWRYSPSTNEWTWMSGSSIFTQGYYGTKGVFDTLNYPGKRFAHTSWTGADGKFWLFGGSYTGLVYDKFLNDLWCFDPMQNAWAWFAGDDSISAYGHYGPECIPADTVTPANGIEGRAAWTDQDGNLWKFGGKYENPANAYTYNQSLLWCFHMQTKSWMLVNSPVPNPNNNLDVQRQFGAIGVPDINSHPGSRCGTASFKDRNGVFYLFGGLTKTAPGPLGGGLDITVNDMWSYEPDPACLIIAGVNEPLSNEVEVTVFPNPVAHELTIKQSAGNYFERFDLLNLNGQLIHSGKLGIEAKLSVETFTSGVYILRLHNATGFRFFKVLIQ